MARQKLRHGDSYVAASAMAELTVVAADPTTPHGVVAVGSSGQKPFGVSLHAASVAGRAIAVHGAGNLVKARAGASLGYGAEVGILAATTSLAPGVASGKWAVGVAEDAAAAGEIFSLYVNPRQVLA